MKIWVSGSLAYDRIMDYPGRFADHINPKKLHILNLSFAAKTLQLSFGGTAGNIAYGLRLLGIRTGVVGNLGSDGDDYLKRIKKQKADTSCLRRVPKAFTAGAYIITDRDDNQISAFFAGAMSDPSSLPKVSPGDVAIVSPDDPKNMMRLTKHYARRGIDYVFDAGQQITALNSSELRFGMRNAMITIGNDYEMDLMAKRSKVPVKSLKAIITTYGAKGSAVQIAGKTFRIPAVKPKKVVDPTGAGDAYRAGFLAGLAKGFDWPKSARLASTVAARAVETQGTQNYKLNTKSRQV